MIDSEDYDPVEQEGFAGEMQRAFVEALRRRGIDAGPEHVSINGAETNRAYFQFTLRVSGDGCLLPQVRAIARECIREGSQEGTKHILIGSIQRAFGKTRAVVRMVVVETALIDSGGKGDANGTDADAVSDALGKALDVMEYKIACAKGVAR